MGCASLINFKMPIGTGLGSIRDIEGAHISEIPLNCIRKMFPVIMTHDSCIIDQVDGQVITKYEGAM